MIDMLLFKTKVQEKQWDEVRELCKPENGILNARDSDNLTALHYVGMDNDLETCEHIVNFFDESAKAQVRAFFAGGAAYSGNVENTLWHLSQIKDLESRKFASIHVCTVALNQGHDKVVLRFLPDLDAEYYHQLGNTAEAKNLKDLASCIFNALALKIVEVSGPPAVVFSTMKPSVSPTSQVDFRIERPTLR